MRSSSSSPFSRLLGRLGFDIGMPISPQPNLPSAKELALPISRLRELLSYEPGTGTLRWKFRPGARTEWNNRYAGTVAGTTRNGAIQVRIQNGSNPAFFLAHRIAWALHFGQWPSHIVDHADCDQGNNRISNLRRADSSQNNCNRHVVAGSLPFKGVYFNVTRGKYAAQIKKDHKWEWLGLHDLVEDAARAYDARATELHGDFAKTNWSLGLL